MTEEQKDDRSLFVSAVVKNKDKYVFLIKTPDQWNVDSKGNLRLPFGAVETSVNRGETVETALLRRLKEDIGTEAKILDSKTSHLIFGNMIDEMSMNAKSNKPLFIYKDDKIENNKHKYDYIYSFLAETDQIDELRPQTKNAVLLMDRSLLNKAAKGTLSIGELKKRGGKIISEINLPEDALLYPTASSKGIYLCGGCR